MIIFSSLPTCPLGFTEQTSSVQKPYLDNFHHLMEANFVMIEIHIELCLRLMTVFYDLQPSSLWLADDWLVTKDF